MTTRLSRHAAERRRQRSIPAPVLAFFLKEADRWEPAGGGCERLTLSIARAAGLIAADAPRALVERALQLGAIVGQASIVTVFRLRRRPSMARLGRRRRRDLDHAIFDEAGAAGLEVGP